jgi:Ferric uptake regulator family
MPLAPDSATLGRRGDGQCTAPVAVSLSRVICPVIPVSKPVAPGLAGEGRELSSVVEVLALVRAKGGRATPPRRTLLEVLFEADGHLSAEELAATVQAKTPEVHISTIYRNLEDLQRLGVVVHSHLGHGPATYQLSWRPWPTATSYVRCAG